MTTQAPDTPCLVPGAVEAFKAVDVADRLIERAYGLDTPADWTEAYRNVAKARAAAPAVQPAAGREEIARAAQRLEDRIQKRLVERYGPNGADYEPDDQDCDIRLLIAAISTPAQASERAVKVCPQCDGEGFYADGVDEAACSTECTRCGSNGWIVDLAALSAPQAAPDEGEQS